MMNIPDWVGVLLPFASGAAGIGVAYGALKIKLVEHDRRLTLLENKSCSYLTESHYKGLQQMCRDGLKEDIEEIKTELKDNRLWMNVKFNEISRFMGSLSGK